MTNRTNPETLPSDAEYQAAFRRAVDGLVIVGADHCIGLLPCDVVGAFISAGVGLARSNGIDIAAILRSVADDVEANKPRAH